MTKTMNRKPVVDATAATMWNYAYQAKRFKDRGVDIIASDSLHNLRREARDRGWRLAWLTMTTGSFSCGQNVVDEYPYQPRR